MRWVAGLIAGSVVFAAAPVFANEFVAFFDYGQTTLTAEGYANARRVAAYARSGTPRQIIIDGHMDTAEDDEFSEDLGLARARSTERELISLGVDPSLIEIRSYGSSALGRATGDHVREQLNRRVLVNVYF